MIVPVLWCCTRCGLRWAPEDDGVPEKCPKCLRSVLIPPQVVVAGRDVTALVVREYGAYRGLEGSHVRFGMSDLKLGQCPHGHITSAICDECPA